MEQKFLNFVAEIMEMNEVSMDMSYNEGKWNSLMMLTLVMELEAEYGVSIPMEKLGNIKTLDDIYKLLNYSNLGNCDALLLSERETC